VSIAYSSDCCDVSSSSYRNEYKVAIRTWRITYSTGRFVHVKASCQTNMGTKVERVRPYLSSVVVVVLLCIPVNSSTVFPTMVRKINNSAWHSIALGSRVPP
jgi:hypothetical protein